MSINPYLSSINSGEFSPRMEARVDFERYANAAKLCRNLVLYPQGGVTRRPGTKFVKEVKSSSLESKLVSFEYSEDDSYMLEFFNTGIRFMRRQGAIVVEDTNAAIVNGTFTSNITDWDNQSTGSAAIAHDSTNGRLQLTGHASGIAWASQDVAVSSANKDKVHVLKFRIAGDGGGKVGFQVGSTATGSDIFTEVQLSAGENSIEFTPGVTTFYIQFRNDNTPVRNMFIDNVELIDDAALELVSPYATADLAGLRYYQAADIVYICHHDYKTRRLERRGHRSWSLAETFLEDGPYLEINDGRELSSYQLIPNGLFENGMTSWTDASSGNGFLNYNESGKFAELDPGTSAGSGLAVLRNSTTVVSGLKHTMHVLVVAAGNVTLKVGTSAGATTYINQTLKVGWTTVEFTTSNTALHVSFEYNDYDQGRAGIGGCLLYSTSARLLEVSATGIGSMTLTAHGFTPFTSDDVGRLVRLEWPGQDPGYGVITAFSSSSSVSFLALRSMASDAPTETWRLGAFGGDQGHPKVVSFFDGRSAFANTPAKPNSGWLSQSGKLENFRPDSFSDGELTVEDDDAISFTLRSTKINPIFWMSGQRQLMIGTAGGQWVIQSSGAAITPSDISAKQHAAVSCSDMKNIEINQTILFADRARREVHELGFSLQDDSFLATDLTILSDHIFRSNIEEMVYQRNPYSIIWCRRADGRLASLSYNKQHQVLGWSQTILGGSFGSGDAVVESIATIPGSDDEDQDYPSDERNELWMIVKRTIDGSTKRYIEFMEYFYNGPLREDYDTEAEWRDAVRDDQTDAFYVDCGLTYDGSATAVVTNLDHLEGQVVKVLADGVVVADKTVSGGNITLNDPASKIHVGLSYKHKYESLKLAAATSEGSGVGKVKTIKELGLVLLDSYTFQATTTEYDADGRRIHTLRTIDMRRNFMNQDDTIPLFTGERKITTNGVWSTDSRIYAEGDNPLPWTLLGLAPQMEIRAV